MARLLLLIALAGIVPPLSAADYVDAAKTIVSQLATGQYDKVEAQFADPVKAAVSANRLESVWQMLVNQAGPFQSIAATQVVHQQGLEVVIVTCAFAKANLDAQIAFNPEGKVAGLYFRPSPPQASWSAPPYANPQLFQERAVTVRDGKFELPGILTLPIGKPPFPAVILVHGSGPEDADETVGPNKPFKDLAWGLASRGIAVLRYVKRTRQYGSASMNPGFTVADETIDDADAAVALMRTTPEIDSGRIFVLGHSLGGTLAPRIAQHAKLAGLIILAGSTRPLEASVLAQLRYLASLHDSPQIQNQIAEARRAAAEIESPSLRADTTVNLLGASVPGSYFLDLRGYHPAEVAARLHIPMLVLQGGRDYQVTQEDLQGWKRALAGRRNVVFHEYPQFTHLFMLGKAPAPASPADYEVAGHVSVEVIDDIAKWVATSR